MIQVLGARHAHVEQPRYALSWKTKALKHLPGYDASFDQCMYGAVCMNEQGLWLPVRKSTTIRTTKKTVYEVLSLRCDGSHQHCSLEGSAVGFGRRTRYMEDFQPCFAASLATALTTIEEPHHWEVGFAVAIEDERKEMGELVKLKSEFHQEAVRTVQKLHRNLGHPSIQSLVELLESRGASQTVIDVAKQYLCAACSKYKKPNQAAPSTFKQSKQFNAVLQADVFWVKIEKEKFAVMSLVDSATRYSAASLLKNERSEEYIKALERCWIRHYGAPRCLLTDEGRPWLGAKFDEWTSAHGIEHVVAPGEAHERLAIVERRHAVLRKAIEIYIDDMKKKTSKGIREAITYIVPQQNATPTVAGYSPVQWVMGYQPELTGDLMSTSLNPAHLGGNSTFEEILLRRTAAKTALINADADRKLRRALNRRYQGTNRVYKLGERVWFWRDARQADLVKIRWLGPAFVVMREEEMDGTPLVYWLSFKTQLIRCAPHHVRGDVKGTQPLVEDLRTSLNEVRQLKSRGVTRYYDLNVVNKRRLDDVEDDEEVEDPNGNLEESDHDMSPPLRRPRLMPPVPEPVVPEEDDYSPEARHDGDSAVVPRDPELPDAELDVSPAGIDEVPRLVSTGPAESVPEPNEEPPAVNEPLSSAVHPEVPARPRSMLDPQTAALYEPADAEDEGFQQRRLRFERQETLSFGPWRTRPSTTSTSTGPYVPEPPPEDVASVEHMFFLEDMDCTQLPRGWHMEDGYLMLDETPRDYWEVKAGCLLRHHVVPRRGKMSLQQLPKDVPIPVENLDHARVTVVKKSDGKFQVFTDAGDDTLPPVDHAWTGVTVFQIDGKTRRELAMYTKDPMMGAKQVAKDFKIKEVRKAKKDKNAVNERLLTPEERALFKEAKVKELKSFFENQVWEFQTTKEASTERTMSAKILTHWKKNPDGTRRAKARLIVRGYTDPDALEGRVETSSPTTSRLSRSMLLSLAATMGWNVWTADVSTAFLQGRPQNRKLWVKLPSEALALLGADESTRMLLLKPCYGQIDAPRGWYLEAVDRLLKKGLKQHALDPCCFLIYEDLSHSEDADNTSSTDAVFGPSQMCGMVIMHVDDMLGAGCPTSERYRKTIEDLKSSFTFREWKEDDNLEYCGCELLKTESKGLKLCQGKYMKKVHPVTVDRKRDLHEPLRESEVTQLRGLLGSLQWPSVQSSPHLQCSTSLLAGQVGRATNQTLLDANRLLKFAKENADIGLSYEHIGPAEKLRLVCFFDAAFATRADGSSQAGYIAMLMNEDVLQSSGQEGAYHILDWRSFKTPRVARSSLGAEAQGGGQASDAVEYICRFWSHLQFPNASLQSLLNMSSTLKPVMVTDAKALYDSYHREGAGNSVIDKRVSLEIRVMKERVQELSGNLRWMSSERQYADGLTKESARLLMAQRLRHGKLKMVWDPNYVAAKKKTKDELKQSLNESTQVNKKKPMKSYKKAEREVIDEFQAMELNEIPKNEDASQNDLHPEENDTSETVQVDVNNDASQNAMFVATDDILEYVNSPSHVGVRMNYVNQVRMQNNLSGWLRLVVYLMGINGVGGHEQCPLVVEKNETEDSTWLLVVGTILALIVTMSFVLGRWSVLVTARKPCVDAAVQKDEQLVPARLKELLRAEQVKSGEWHRAAVESREALKLATEEMLWQRAHIRDGCTLVRKMEHEMRMHASECPYNVEIEVAKKTGTCWHFAECPAMRDVDPLFVGKYRACQHCVERSTPPSRVDHVFGSTLEDEIEEWFLQHY